MYFIICERILKITDEDSRPESEDFFVPVRFYFQRILFIRTIIDSVYGREAMVIKIVLIF